MDLRKIIFKYGVYFPVVSVRGEQVFHHLSALNRSQWCSQDELANLQLTKLRNLIDGAKKDVPFYQDRFHLIELSDLKRISDLAVLPLLEKDMVREKRGELLSRHCSKSLTKKTTSGSTGTIVTIWKDPDAMGQELAAAWRGYAWAGIDIGDKQGRFWGVPSAKRDRLRARLIDFVTHRRRFSAFSFDEESLEEYTRELSSFKPKYLYGYVSMLVEYAKYLQGAKKRLPFPLKCVITTAEVLTEPHRTTLQDQFSCRVVNEYGCGEVGTIAHECEMGSLHVNAENMIIEILRDGQPCKADELGDITVTELNNRAMPLVRYRIGDIGILASQQCPCGRGLPVLGKIFGRAYDIIYNRQGKSFHGEFFLYIFEDAKRNNLGIKAFQVIQIDRSTIKIRLVREPGYSDQTMQFIERRMRSSFDSQVTLQFEFVEEIRREASGKMRLVVGMNSVASGI